MALPFPNSFRPETWKGPRSQQFPKREDAFQQLVGDVLREALPGGAFPVRTSGPDGSIDAFIAQDASLAPLFQHLPGPVIVECKDNDDTLPQVQKNVLGAWTKVKAKLAEQADKGWPDRFAPWREARGYLFLTSAVFPDTEARRQLERTLSAFFDTLRAEGKCQIEQVRVADWSDLRDALDRWPRVADRWLGVGLRKVVGHDEHKEVLAADFRRFLLAHHLPFCAPEPGGPTHPHTLLQGVMDRAQTGGVLVTGPGGVGKTRLLVEVGELAHTRGLRVLHVLPGAPALDPEELFERVLQGQRDTLLLFDYVDEASIDFDAVRRHLLPEAARRGMRVGVLASARSRRNVQRRNDRGAFFEHRELRLDDAHAGRLLGQMRLCVAPTATALLGERAVIELAGTRPIIALLVLRELERRAALGQLRESSLRGIRSGDLVGWLRRRLAEDELLVRPAASPWEEDEIPPRLVATAAILASSPQGEEALRAVALLATRGLPRGEQLAQRAVPALVELGWLEEREGGFSAVHDVIVDEVLGQTLGDASGALREELLWRLLEPGKRSARTLACLMVSFRRLLADLETASSGFGPALAEATRGWLTRWVSELGALLADCPPGEGSYLLATLLYDGVWAPSVELHWDTLVAPWLQRHATHPDARHLFFIGLGQLEDRGQELVELALRWLGVNGRGFKACFVLARLLGREHLSPEQVSNAHAWALLWLDLHGLHPQAPYVLGPLLKREDLTPKDAASLRRRALSWLSVHARTHSACYVLPPLLVRTDLLAAECESACAHALVWLRSFRGDVEASFVLTALVRREEPSPEVAREVITEALAWLKRHHDHSHASWVLRVCLQSPHLDAERVEQVLDATVVWVETRPSVAYCDSVLARALRFKQAPPALLRRLARLGIEWLKQTPDDEDRHDMLTQLLPHGALLSPDELLFVANDAVRWVKALPPEKDTFLDLMRIVRRATRSLDLFVKTPFSGWKPGPAAPSKMRVLSAELRKHLPPQGEPVSTDFLRGALLRIREQRTVESLSGRVHALTLLLPLAANTADAELVDGVESALLKDLQSDMLEPYQINGTRKGCLKLLEEGAWKDEAQGRRSLQRLGLFQPEAPEG
ncbi:hypothetical protein [Archangium primigenium]|uniref:hypothetical protein n=1 Tax=[Archangium] primigenium TaxID=2792470 RepID=UPI001956402C|nr:hypothetical protein [Archangium primigenium]MBM7113363.1 hypothetical protein [Archangium primigenium]